MDALLNKAKTYTNAEIISAIKAIGAKSTTAEHEELILSVLIDVCIDRLIESGKTGDEAANYIDELLGQ